MHAPPAVTERLISSFRKRTSVSDGCWLWTGYRNDMGYGQLHTGKKHHRAHRLSWLIHHGSLPKDKCVLHKCDNPPCVNPEHLFLGTIKDNTLDMVAKGRARGSRGESHFKAKLRKNQVIEINARIAKGERLAALAREYGVTHSTISNIKRRKNWKWLKSQESDQ